MRRANGFKRIVSASSESRCWQRVPGKFETMLPDRGRCFPETGLELKINDNDTDKILIYKGTPLAYELSMEYIDAGLLYHENYYYLRVTQIDGNMAWSSPIWVQYD